MTKKKHIVLGVTGSIAAYKAADIIRRLQDNDFEVSVIMTQAANKFISPLTLSSLSGNKVYQDMFEEHESNINHVSLAQRAEIVLVAPATANIIGKIASGIADNLLLCTIMATKAPKLIAPAMNNDMYNNDIFKDNCAKLKKYGFHFIDPIKGKLACGTIGEGHLAEIGSIVTAVKENVH